MMNCQPSSAIRTASTPTVNILTACIALITLLLSNAQALQITCIEQLDEVSVFHFSIMSDNKGDGVERDHVARWNEWDQGSEFCLGLGDNLQHNGEPFLSFIENDSCWKKKFFPNVGDGENQHFSGSQADWGTGWEIFNHMDDFFNRPGVTFRPLGPDNNDRKVDYKYVFNKNGFTVTAFSLHKSDQYDGSMGLAIGGLANITQEWLYDELLAIHAEGKSNKHIVVILFHTDTKQDVVKVLPESLRNLVISTADLTVGASTHRYGWMQRYQNSNNGNGMVKYNSGALGHGKSTTGYSEVHVLDNPPRFTLQYINSRLSTRQLHVGQHADFIQNTNPGVEAGDQRGTPIIKIINGPYGEVDWNNIDLTPPAKSAEYIAPQTAPSLLTEKEETASEKDSEKGSADES